MVGKLTPNYFLWQRCQNLWQRCQNILESFGVKRLLHLKKIHDTITQSLFLKVYLILPPHTKIESYFYFDATRQVKMPKLMNLNHLKSRTPLTLHLLNQNRRGFWMRRLRIFIARMRWLKRRFLHFSSTTRVTLYINIC